VSELQYALRKSGRPKDINAIEPWPDSDDYTSSDGLWSLGDATLKIFVHHDEPTFHTRSLVKFDAGGKGSVTGFRIVVPHAEVERASRSAHMGIGGIVENAGKLIQQDRKLLIWHNLSDQLLTPYMSINYYKALAKGYGGYEKLQRNVRLFTIPGSGHCSMSGVGPNNFDALTAIEAWVEEGKAPDSLLAKLYSTATPAIDASKTPLRTMPLCKFPEMAHYGGRGDLKDAANWSCRSGDTSMLEIGESGRRAGVVE
jgi:feruloyl esterase